MLKNTWMIKNKERTASGGEQDRGDINKNERAASGGDKTVEIQIADGTSKTRHRRTPSFKPPECRWPLCCSWMGVDGVVVSKVNFSNQHLGFLQAPSSLMKYKNETHVGHIYLSIIDILSYL